MSTVEDVTATDIDTPALQVAHLSDSHIGYSAYRVLAPNGSNQRTNDIGKAFSNAIDDIIANDPPLVVHSGDIADRPDITVRTILFIKLHLGRLAGIRPDGTRRQVVVIAGNHDLPSSRRETCFLELLRDLPGVHIVTDDYRTVQFDAAAGADAALDDVVVHCLPHDSLKDLAQEARFDEVTPTPAKTNILVAHGVAGGSGLFKRVMGREYAIPTEVLSRPWDYVALGHWHRQGPVTLASVGHDGGETGRVWYAGSTENCGFGDLLDNGTRRGYLAVEVARDQMPQIRRVDLPIRLMHRLAVLDGTGMDPDEIADELRSRIEAGRADGMVEGAIVGQIVKGVTRDVWSLVDTQSVRNAAAGALHYEITVEPVRADADTIEPIANGGSDLARVLEERAQVVLTASERDAAVELARTLLNAHLSEPLDADGDSSDDSSADDTDAGGATAGGTDEATAADVADDHTEAEAA